MAATGGRGPRPEATATVSGLAPAHAYTDAATRVTLRPIASPLTMAFLALAVGTFVLAGLQLSWIPPAQSPDVGLILMAFVFPLQAASSVFGFLARDTIVGTGAGLLSGTWLSAGVVMFASPPGHTSGALGLLLAGAATALLIPALVGAADKPLASLVIIAASVRFF